jgi:GNAT superfamily N-acetyltransferase
VRQATPADREALVRMFSRCTLDTRYLRFHAPVKAIPERYLTEALSGSAFHYALVACLSPEERPATDPLPALGVLPGPVRHAVPVARHQEDAGQIVALASCRLTAEGVAELGVLVEDAWQRRGLGRRLLHDLVTHASRAGLRGLEARVLAERAWVAALLRPYGTCRLRSTRDGVMNLTVRLAR